MVAREGKSEGGVLLRNISFRQEEEEEEEERGKKKSFSSGVGTLLRMTRLMLFSWGRKERREDR